MRSTLDAARSSVKIRTRAVGMLASLAHDLELEATGGRGHLDEEGERWTAELSFPVSGLRVVGVVRRGRIDRTVLSPGDVAEIERKIRLEVFGVERVMVRGSGDRRHARLDVEGPRGREELSVPLAVEVSEDGTRTASGAARLSLGRLGCAEVRAPLGAFRTADAVDVDARVTFVAEVSAP